MNRFAKHTLTLGLVSLGLVAACASQPKPVAVNVPPPAAVAVATPVIPPPPAPVTPAVPADSAVHVSGDGWSFTCPNDNWESVDVHKDGVLALVNNPSEKRRILLLGQSFEGPPALFPIIMLAGAKEHGGTVTLNKEAVINGRTYTSAQVENGALNLHLWITVKDKVGYAFICGGHATEDLAEVCGGIAATLELK
jgi:hypothetical protein